MQWDVRLHTISFIRHPDCSRTHLTSDEVDWPQAHRTLKEEVPRLFQVWALGVQVGDEYLSDK